ncbi:hypothetical protein JKP88DRAFT_247763 [Tribonema minus]|uniref:Uncharacterized protein n=1 Tax=Tribonema minus TaxID=303371 RepID=A0A836CAV5_9STRA|nr:hypothetical protein JKP88DRAFT_247763 [Tribonema minus]
MVVSLSMYLWFQRAPQTLSFNAFTGEWTTPQSRTIVTVAPRTEFPIKSEFYRRRIAALRAARSVAPKGVAPERVGRRYCQELERKAAKRNRAARIGMGREPHRKAAERSRVAWNGMGSCIRAFAREPVVLVVGGARDAADLLPLLRAFAAGDVYEVYAVWALGPEDEHAPLKREWQRAAADVLTAPGPYGWGALLQSYAPVAVIGTSAAGNAIRNSCVLLQSYVLIASLAPAQRAMPSKVGPSRTCVRSKEAAVRGASPFVHAFDALLRSLLLKFTERCRAAARARRRAIRDACAQHQGASAPILMPPQDVASAAWTATLEPVALASWHIPKFSVSVITNDRREPWSLLRLLSSLRGAALFGDAVPVSFNVDSSADDETLQLVQEFSGLWGKRGRTSTSLRTLKAGLIRAVTESYYPTDKHHHCVLLEDDIEVSPLFYAWAKYTTLTYQYGAPADFEPDMYGISLYTPRLNEISPRPYVYDSNAVIARRTGGQLHMPYLHQTPCSWGGVYFAEAWMEFRAYLAARLKEEHIVVHVPAARTNWWRVSWKRYFIEMAYQRDYYMLYPNYHNQTSFATNWLEPGQHIHRTQPAAALVGPAPPPAPPAPPVRHGDASHRPEHYTVPLMALASTALLDQLPAQRLPPLSALPRLDVLDQFAGNDAELYIAVLRALHRYRDPHSTYCMNNFDRPDEVF